MSVSVPAEYEAAARDVALNVYGVDSEDAAVLASDPRFALAAHLRREALDAVDVIRPDDVEDATDEEIEALRDIYAACGALTDTAEHTAESALDRDVTPLTVKERFAAVKARRGESDE